MTTSAATATPPLPRIGWSRFGIELADIVAALSGRRCNGLLLCDQIAEVMDTRPLRVLGRRRAAIIRPLGGPTAPCPFERPDEQRDALERLRVDVAHSIPQRELVDELLAGTAALRPGRAVEGVQLAARLNGRAILELGRPVVAVACGGRLEVDADPWPDPIWEARCGFASALRQATEHQDGAMIDHGPLWVAPSGRFGDVCPPTDGRWIELMSTGPETFASIGGNRPMVRLVDDRLPPRRMSWRDALDCLAAQANLEPPAPSGTAAPPTWPERAEHLRIVEDICGEHDVEPGLVADLMRVEIDYRSRASRSGVLGALQAVLDDHLEARQPPALPEPSAVLVGCVKGKAGVAAPARDLYRGQLWTLRRRYVEARALPWAIVSRGLGVVQPGAVVEPYEQRIEELDEVSRARWRTLAHDGLAALQLDPGASIEVIAGAAYVDALRPVAADLGVELLAPLAGLGIGQRKKWLKARIDELAADAPAAVSNTPLEAPTHTATEAELELLAAAVEARPGHCWWVDDFDEGFELVDVAAELVDRPVIVGAVLWAMTEDCEAEPCAELGPAGWVSAATAASRWGVLMRRHALIGRFWPADEQLGPFAAGAAHGGLIDLQAGEVRVVDGEAFARLVVADVDELAAQVDELVDRVAAQHPELQRVVISTGAAVAIDVCPGPLARAARAAARAAAEDVGRDEAGDPPRAASLHAAALQRPDLAEEMLGAAEGHITRLGKLLARGADPAPALPAPPAFAEAWDGGDDLVAATVLRARTGEGGRPRSLSLEAYVAARQALQTEGADPNDKAIRRAFAAQGVKISRSTVRQRRLAFERLLEHGLPEGELHTGLAVVAAGLFDGAMRQHHAAFAEAWDAAAGLVQAKTIRQRQHGGRGRALALSRYVRARRAVQTRGDEPTDDAVHDELAAEGVKVRRRVVADRRREFLRLDATALAQLDDDVRRAGLDAIAATAVMAARPSPPGRRVVIPWVGGKSRVLEHVVAALPDGQLDYAEVCAGGLTVGLHLLEQGRIRRAVFADADPDIIHFWRWLRRDPEGVFETASAAPWTAEAYYQLRERFNHGEFSGLQRAAAFFRLIWQGHDGLWRRNTDGTINVPVGRRDGIEVPVERLVDVAELLRANDVRFVCGDAEDVIDELGGGPWVVYVDPPYWPILSFDEDGKRRATGSFCNYGGLGFQAGDQARLIAAGRRHAAAGGVAVFSNHACAPVLKLLEGADVTWLRARRSVGRGEGGAHEVVACLGPRMEMRCS